MNWRAFPVLLALGLSVVASAQSTYLALGDSVAFGFQPVAGNPFGNAPANGDMGYVSILADALGAGGTRPTVKNLAIPAESSTSFRDLSNVYRGGNTNYGLNPFAPRPITQYDFALEVIAGGNVDNVSFALGANDVLSLLTPGFLALTDAQRQAQVDAARATFRTNTAAILTGLTAALPSAKLYMPGYYNPYPAGSPLGSIGADVVQQLNTDIQGLAATYGGRYIDFYSPIVGKELLLTHIGEGDIHPNDAGYAALGRAAVQAVPEPASMAALGLGALAMLRRRRRA